MTLRWELVGDAQDAPAGRRREVAGRGGNRMAEGADDCHVVRRCADQRGRRGTCPLCPEGVIVAGMQPGLALGQDAGLSDEAHLAWQRCPGGSVQVTDMIRHLELMTLAGEQFDGVHGLRCYRRLRLAKTNHLLTIGMTSAAAVGR